MILYLGMVRRGEYETFLRRGLPVGILVDIHTEHRLADVTGFALVERFDFSLPLPDLIARVREINARHAIDCIFNVMEFYVTVASQVASALGLPNITQAAAGLCRDKVAMRRRFQERIGQNSCARFQVIDSEAGLLKIAGEWGYPLFLQPANVSASMWATRNHDQQKLLGNYLAMVKGVPAYLRHLGQAEGEAAVICAEYLSGANTSIDCVVGATGQVFTTPIVDVQTGQDVGIDDFHHFSRILPSRCPPDIQRHLENLAVAGTQALSMSYCAAHVEFIGSKLGEIAARPGGNRPRILELAYGIDELFAYYQILRGEQPNLGHLHFRSAAIVTPYAPRDGILRAINHIDEVPLLPTYLYHEVRAPSGQRVGLSKTGHRTPLYIELQSADPEAVRRDVATIASWTDLYVLE